jgi:hypothetical protein
LGTINNTGPGTTAAASDQSDFYFVRSLAKRDPARDQQCCSATLNGHFYKTPPGQMVVDVTKFFIHLYYLDCCLFSSINFQFMN